MVNAVLSNVENNVNAINFGRNGVSLKQFLNINDIDDITKDTKDRIKTALNINLNDDDKIEFTSVLVNRWMLYEVNNESVYIKHTSSDRMNVLYQIVLGGQEWDGIYEFMLKGRNIKTKGYIIDNKKTLSIESKGNYDVAMFGQGSDKPYSVTRLDFKTDEEFKKALLQTGLITEEDLEIYYKPDKIIEPYLNKVLPRIALD